MSLQNQYNDFKRHAESGALSDPDPRRCKCHGGGWILSDFDTFHKCPSHTGRYHPENDHIEGRTYEWFGGCQWERVGENVWLLRAYYHGYGKDAYHEAVERGEEVVDDAPTWVEYTVDENGRAYMKSGWHEGVKEWESVKVLRKIVSWQFKENLG